MSGVLCYKLSSLGVQGEIPNNHSITRRRECIQKRKWTDTNGENEKVSSIQVNYNFLKIV